MLSPRRDAFEMEWILNLLFKLDFTSPFSFDNSHCPLIQCFSVSWLPLPQPLTSFLAHCSGFPIKHGAIQFQLCAPESLSIFTVGVFVLH